MATTKQKRVAKLIVENHTLDKPLNYGQMLEKVRYSKGIQEQPSRVIESEGVKEELAVMGFTPHAAKTVVSKIMNNDEAEPNARLKAADMTFKVHGTYAPEKTVSVNIEATVSPEALALAQQILEHRRSKISESGDGIISEPVGGEVQNQE